MVHVCACSTCQVRLRNENFVFNGNWGQRKRYVPRHIDDYLIHLFTSLSLVKMLEKHTVWFWKQFFFQISDKYFDFRKMETRALFFNVTNWLVSKRKQSNLLFCWPLLWPTVLLACPNFVGCATETTLMGCLLVSCFSFWCASVLGPAETVLGTPLLFEAVEDLVSAVLSVTKQE